jgi:NADP-dependent 3-hydroxy acid dehydrogenase YdfG
VLNDAACSKARSENGRTVRDMKGENAMLLQNKIAVIYGAGGAIGSAIASAFAREGAKLFLTGRHRTSVEAVAKEVASAGGSAEAAEVDADRVAVPMLFVTQQRPPVI